MCPLIVRVVNTIVVVVMVVVMVMPVVEMVSAGMFALVFNWVVSILVLCNIYSILLLKRIITSPEALI